MRTAIATLAIALSCAFGPSTTRAETAEDIVRALMPKPLTRSFRPAEPAAPTQPGGMTRSFRPSEPAPQGLTRGVQVEGGEPAAEEPPKIDLYVNFEYNNAALTLSDARVALDALGKALQDTRLSGMRFAIIGHTDAAGGDAYNLDLSRRRAESVRQYLMQFHKIAATRLDADGRGMRELKDTSRPTDGVNRRVEIRNLTGQPLRPPPPAPAISSTTPPPRIASNEPMPPRPAAPPPSQARWAERADYGFGDRPRERIDRLPDRPNPWTTENAAEQRRQQLGLAQRAVAFTNRGDGAAAMFLALLENRFARKGTPADVAEVTGQADLALEASSGVGQLTARQVLNRFGIRDARAVAFVIAQAWRNLEQNAEFATADEARRTEILQQVFAAAGQEVVLQTRAVYEAARLKRSADDLVAAIADLRTRGVTHPELEEMAADHALSMMRALEGQTPALREEDRSDAGTVVSLETRRRLLDCIAMRLGTVVAQSGSTASGNSPGTSPTVRKATLAQRPLLASIVDDSAANCAPLLTPANPAQSVPTAPIDALPAPSPKARKADGDGAGTPAGEAPRRLAGQPLE